MQAKQKAEKITVTIPQDLKEQLLELKKKRHTSLSAIYKEALEAYIKQEELQRWENGARLAAKDEEYLDFIHEIGEGDGELYEY